MPSSTLKYLVPCIELVGSCIVDTEPVAEGGEKKGGQSESCVSKLTVIIHYSVSCVSSTVL